jgi:thiamine-monophosphate kinase
MLGEFELLERIRARIGELGADSGAGVVVGSGDDAAVTVRRGAAATSVDAFVDGVHFRRAISGLAAAGRKALAAALSDLAAMGAEPGEAYVSLGIPEDLNEADCLELLEGLAAGAVEWRTALAGGDVSRSPTLFIALTVVGYAPEAEDLVRREGARPGDVVAVTGELGGAAAGLLLLERDGVSSAVPTARGATLRGRQLEPRPRLEAGMALARSGASAMIDVSDGLGGDALHLASAGGVRLEVELERLPVQEGVREIAAAAGIDWVELAAGGGEDYELLACLPERRLEQARAAVVAGGSRLTAIGRVSEGEGLVLRDASGAARAVAGYDQLRRASAEPA